MNNNNPCPMSIYFADTFIRAEINVQLFAEFGKFDYMWSSVHAVVG
jgi:hypothetical protein